MLRRLMFMLICLMPLQSIATYDEPPFVNRPAVQTFINSMVKKHHFKKPYLEKLFKETKVRRQIIQHFNKPLEKGKWHTYQLLFVSDWRVKHGVDFWKKYEKELKRAEKVYGVPPSIIVATIGIESRYGERIGDYRVMDSLTNLAFSNSSRAKYFKSELEQFLLLTREKHLDPMSIMGSYAGAIGQPQFMPTSYRLYAVNFSKNGKIDLMNNEVDVIGSVANYYNKAGWKPCAPVAAQALAIGDRFNYLLKKGKIKEPIPVSDLSKYGIVLKHKPQNENLLVKVIELEDRYKNEYWIGYHNFDVIKRYNASNLYAMAVYQLSNSINELKDRN